MQQYEQGKFSVKRIMNDKLVDKLKHKYKEFCTLPEAQKVVNLYFIKNISKYLFPRQ
jgi:hypothetical protein